MFAHSVGLSTLLYLVAVSSAKAEVRVANNAFHNVRVSFAPNVSPEDGKTIVQNLQELLRNTSRTLHTASGYRIGSVSFHLPDTWDTSGWEITDVLTGPPVTADFVIDNDERSAFGDGPLARQFGGCGVGGLHVRVPVEYLKKGYQEGDYPKEKQIAREWIKYRYGVFDENGFHGDELYPTHYKVPGSASAVKITECTDPKVTFELKTLEGEMCPAESDQNCFPQPIQDNITDVKSSLMFFHKELPQVDVVCGRSEHHHNFDTFSMHNILCEEKSIWDVMSTSKDYTDYQEVEWTDEDIEFSFYQEYKPRVALALEKTDTLAQKRDPILFAAGRLLLDLSGRGKSAVYLYEKTVTTFQELSIIAQDLIKETWWAKPEDICTACALQRAANDLLNDNSNTPGHIILITSSPLLGENDGFEKLKNSHLCVSIIIFANTEEEGKVVEESYSQFAEGLSCISITVLDLSDSDLVSFQRLNTLLRSHLTLRPARDVAEVEIATGVMTSEDAVSFPTHDEAQLYTLWFSSATSSDAVSCTSGNENIILTDGLKKSSLSSMTFEAIPTGDDVTCRFVHDKDKPLTQVMMETKPGKYFEADVWTRDTSNNEDHQMPIVIYLKLEYDHSPVFDADIEATVQAEGLGNFTVHLFDNGRGDPDITGRDGIYSGYFLEFYNILEKEYTVTVVARKKSSAIAKEGHSHCCGSTLKARSSDPVPNFEITKTVTFTTDKSKPPLGYPPSRINDLRAEIHNAEEVLLTWTAPGNGKASSYKIFVNCNSPSCREDGTLPSWMTLNKTIETPNNPGESEKAYLILKPSDIDLPSVLSANFHIISVSSSGQPSKPSNRIEVNLQPPVIDQPSTTPKPEDKPIDEADKAGVIVGSIIIAVTLLCCFTGAIYAVIKRRKMMKRNPDFDKNPENLNCTERSGSFQGRDFGHRVQSMRRVESFPVILYTHDQLKDFKKSNKDDPPLYKPPNVPKLWMSADALTSVAEIHSKGSEAASTAPINGGKAGLDEMKQLDEVSVHSEKEGKIAKF